VARILRLATPGDAPALLAIYSPFITEGPTSFEAVPPTLAEFAQRMSGVLERLPWLVCECDGVVAGYAYAAPHRERAAYRWCVETSIYVADSHRRLGVGQGLYRALAGVLRAQGFYNAYAGITLPNEASVALHEACGFRFAGVYHGAGYKLGKWHDVGYWELELRAKAGAPEEPLGWRELGVGVVEEVLAGAG
jgi:L-amino acid N-acyltransferase YncA